MGAHDLTGFDGRTAQIIVREVKAIRRQYRNITRRLNMERSRGGASQPEPKVRFKNGSGETVPAYGVMRITGAETQKHLTIGKPNTTLEPLYLVNDSKAVGNGKFGFGRFLTSHSLSFRHNYVLYNAAATPAYGETWGPANGSWALTKGRRGFKILGGNKTDKTITAAIQTPGELVAARLTAELTEGGTATATILNWNGSTWADGDSITVREFWLGSGESVPADTEVLVASISGEWVVAPLEGGVARNDRIWVYFSLTEHMDATTPLQASATVEDSIGDGAPVATTAITVHDPESMFADCPDGAFGLAVNWGTAASPEYHIVECQRVALRVKLRATQPICNDDNGDVTASLEYVESIDEGEHVIDPEFANIVVTNPGRHAAFGAGTGTGDFVWARRVSNQVNGSAKWEFEINEVELHEYEHTIKVYWDNTAKAIKRDYLESVSIETCSEMQTEVILAFGACPEPE